jgi:hypothetical protein
MEQTTGMLGHGWEEMARRSWNGSRGKGKRWRAEHSVREEGRPGLFLLSKRWRRGVVGGDVRGMELER